MIYQIRKEGGTEDWSDMPSEVISMCLLPGHEYRVKPEPAAPKWPLTKMEAHSLLDGHHDTSVPILVRLIHAANKAIADACEKGQVVPADTVREIEAKARAEGFKKGKEFGIDNAIRATLKHVNVVVTGNGWLKILEEAAK